MRKHSKACRGGIFALLGWLIGLFLLLLIAIGGWFIYSNIVKPVMEVTETAKQPSTEITLPANSPYRLVKAITLPMLSLDVQQYRDTQATQTYWLAGRVPQAVGDEIFNHTLLDPDALLAKVNSYVPLLQIQLGKSLKINRLRLSEAGMLPIAHHKALYKLVDVEYVLGDKPAAGFRVVMVQVPMKGQQPPAYVVSYEPKASFSMPKVAKFTALVDSSLNH